MWLILDRANEDQDRKLAEHVLTVHSIGAAPAPTENELEPLTPQQLRTYIALAKQHSPRIPEDLTDYVAAIYAEMRRQEAMSDRPQSYTTPRTLLSILRLSQALAKLRFDDKVPLCYLQLVLLPACLLAYCDVAQLVLFGTAAVAPLPGRCSILYPGTSTFPRFVEQCAWTSVFQMRRGGSLALWGCQGVSLVSQKKLYHSSQVLISIRTQLSHPEIDLCDSVSSAGMVGLARGICT